MKKLLLSMTLVVAAFFGGNVAAASAASCAPAALSSPSSAGTYVSAVIAFGNCTSGGVSTSVEEAGYVQVLGLDGVWYTTGSTFDQIYGPAVWGSNTIYYQNVVTGACWNKYGYRTVALVRTNNGTGWTNWASTTNTNLSVYC